MTITISFSSSEFFHETGISIKEELCLASFTELISLKKVYALNYQKENISIYIDQQHLLGSDTIIYSEEWILEI